MTLSLQCNVLRRLTFVGLLVILCYSEIKADYQVIQSISSEIPVRSAPLTYQVPLVSSNEAIPVLPVWSPARTVVKKVRKLRLTTTTTAAPSQAYGVPGHDFSEPLQNYGLPNIGATAPAPGYGLPSQDQNEINPVPPGNYGPPSTPSPNYGPPATEPSPNYGPPAQQQNPSELYGAPAQPSPAPSPNYGPPDQQQKPIELYGVPPTQPSPAPSSNYGPPNDQKSLPSSNYGPPASDYSAPSQNYGPPTGAPPQSYGPPAQNEKPLPVYGLPEHSKPIEQPSETYGPAALSFSSDSYSSYGGQSGAEENHGSLVSHPQGSPLVAQLRERIQGLDLLPYYTTDKQLARYIESSGYRVERAVRLLSKTARWRANNKADTKLDWIPSPLLTASFPYECTGATDEGNPVFYLPFGKWDFATVRKAGLGSEIFKYYVRMMEEIRKSTEGKINPKTGEPVDQAVLLENLDGFSLTNLFSIRFNYEKLRFLRNVDRHYPFLLRKWLIVRAPLTFQALWTVIRKATPRLRKNYEIYNRFSIRGPVAVAHLIPNHAIPVELGGAYVSRVTESLTQPQNQIQDPLWATTTTTTTWGRR